MSMKRGCLAKIPRARRGWEAQKTHTDARGSRFKSRVCSCFCFCCCCNSKSKLGSCECTLTGTLDARGSNSGREGANRHSKIRKTQSYTELLIRSMIHEQYCLPKPTLSKQVVCDGGGWCCRKAVLSFDLDTGSDRCGLF